jgi:hypothetical protein
MTNDKVNEVLQWFVDRLEDAGYVAVRADPKATFPTPGIARKHMLWMAKEALTFPAEKLEKKMRWLGYIQGVAWYCDGLSINQLKEQNMPEEEKKDA